MFKSYNFTVGRLVESCPSRICFSTSQALVTHLQSHHTNSNTIPSLKHLQTDLISLAKSGHIEEALKIVHTVKQLGYPLHSNTVCQLLNFSTKWDNKSVFTATLDFINDNKITYDEQLYTTIIRGLLRFYQFPDAMEAYSEMTSKGFMPRRNLLSDLFEDCLKRNNAKNSCFFFDSLLACSFLPPVQLLLEFIVLCLKEELHDYVMKLLEYYSSLNIPLEEELVHQLKWYYNERYVRTYINIMYQ